MIRFFLLLITSAIFILLLASTVYGRSNEVEAKGFAICERIKKQGICEEYRLNTLSASDRELIIEYCTAGERCPDENRIGRCIRYKDPDDIVFDKHYYSGTEKKHDWNASTIEETCINSGGKYEDG